MFSRRYSSNTGEEDLDLQEPNRKGTLTVTETNSFRAFTQHGIYMKR